MRLLAVVVARRFLEVQEVLIIVFNQALFAPFHRTLVAAIFAQDRPRDVDAAELLDIVIGNAIAKASLPCIGKGPERRWNMGADCLAFRPRGAELRASFEFRDHIGSVTDAGSTKERRCLAIVFGSQSLEPLKS